MERARRRLPDYAPGPDELAAVAALVAALDGLPLAIELAAARAGVLSPGEIRARVGARLGVLKRRGGPARHRTLVAAYDRAWEQLSPPEREAWLRCGLFAGAFPAEAAEALIDPPEDALDHLEVLVERGLLRAARAAGGTRFTALASARLYLTQRLAARDDRRDLALRHARWFARQCPAFGLDPPRRIPPSRARAPTSSAPSTSIELKLP